MSPRAASFATAIDHIGPWFGALQLRCFGPRPLLENIRVRSVSTASLNGRIGCKITQTVEIEPKDFNLTDRKDSSIGCYYGSRMPDEPLGSAADDIHFHLLERRSFRVTMVLAF